jgi:predicted RNA-binding protein YlxR (DUF448 family)
MAKKVRPRIKHIPQRTCVGCRATFSKRSLIRLVRTSNGVEIDISGKIPGRGAYLHNVRSCWMTGLKGPLAHALKTELTDADQVKLQEYSASLPEISPEAV